MVFIQLHLWSTYSTQTADSPAVYGAALILSLGLYGGAGHFLLIRAFHESPASRLAPLLYTQIVWAMLLGWMVFGHVPDRMSIMGMLIIGAAGLSLVLGNRVART